jgi:hypothetical protein
VDRENTLFIGERCNAFYEAMLSSEESVSKVVRHHRPDNVERSNASGWLLLYRLMDVITFAHGDRWTDATVPRQRFPTLTIPVCGSPHIRHSLTKSEQGWQTFCGDWPRFVREAGHMLYQIRPEAEQEGVESDITLKHLHSICRRVAMMDRNKMLINFELAAMHISTLLKGKDYPDTVEALADMHNL